MADQSPRGRHDEARRGQTGATGDARSDAPSGKASQNETASQGDGHGATDQEGASAANQGAWSNTGRGPAEVDGGEQYGGGKQLQSDQPHAVEGAAEVTSESAPPTVSSTTASWSPGREPSKAKPTT